MRFSVIVPVHDAERFLRECVESVLAQSCEDFELILVDDGSGDKSPALCDAFAERLPQRVVAMHQPNRGALAARVAGLARAAGEYVCFVDADDVVSPRLLERVSDALARDHADMVVYAAQRIDESGNVVGPFASHLFPAGPVDKRAYFEAWATTSDLNALWLKVVRRELYDMDAVRTEAFNTVNGEDLLWSIPVATAARSITYVDEPLYGYRVNPRSTTQTYREGEHVNLNYGRPLFLATLRELGYDDEETVAKTFDNYLRFVWRRAFRAAVSSNSRERREQILSEIRSYEMVREGERYLAHARLAAYEKAGLRLLYGGRLGALRAYCAAINAGRRLVEHR